MASHHLEQLNSSSQPKSVSPNFYYFIFLTLGSDYTPKFTSAKTVVYQSSQHKLFLLNSKFKTASQLSKYSMDTQS